MLQIAPPARDPRRVTKAPFNLLNIKRSTQAGLGKTSKLENLYNDCDPARP